MTDLSWAALDAGNILALLIGGPFAALCMIGLVEWYLWRRRAAIPLKLWFAHPVYPLWQAAWLWLDLPPQPHIPPDSQAFPILRMLKEAIASGIIQPVPGSGPGMKARVLRSELARLAAGRGPLPRFLR